MYRPNTGCTPALSVTVAYWRWFHDFNDNTLNKVTISFCININEDI